MMATLFESDDSTLEFFELEEETDEQAVTTRHELALARSKLGDLLDLLPAGLLIHQEQGIVYANKEASRILGQPQDALTGRHFLDFIDDADVDGQRDAFLQCLGVREQVRAQVVGIEGGDGLRTCIQISMSPLPWQGLPVIYMLLNDVTVMKQNEERLRMLAVTDPLTGCFNRRYFFDRAERHLTAARRHRWAVSLLTIDIDHFKMINDGYGHASGDEALRALSSCCLGVLRVDDMFARVGGEEFAILLPDTDQAVALEVAERLRMAVEQLIVPLANSADAGQTLRMTISVGVATNLAGSESVDMLMSRSDQALYRAKHEGRNRVVTAVP